MRRVDLEAMARGLVPVVREQLAELRAEIQREIADVVLRPMIARNAELERRLAELEGRAPAAGAPGAPGEPGPAGEGIVSVVVTADGRLLAHTSAGRVFDAGPVPAGPPGPVGPPGAPGAPGAVGADGRAGDRGEPGERGLEGAAGAPGAPGAKGEPGLEGPVGPVGAKGDRGEKGDAGDRGEKGPDGRDGRDGLSVKGERGERGYPGEPGADGLGFEQLEIMDDELRGPILRFVRGDRHRDFPLGGWHDVGVWTAGTTYSRGSGVTWDGHYWIARTETVVEPGEGSPAWRLVTRRGKQGREGRPGKDGAPGRDLTQLGADGKKW